MDAASPGPTRNGSSWSAAYTDLQLALSSAVSGDTIKVAQGTYKPTTTTTRTISFQLKSGVALLGGYAGATFATPDTRDLSLYPTVLSGDIGTPGSKTDNTYHVLTASGVSSTAVLDGFTVTAGNANSLSPNNGGGGLQATGSSPTLRNVIFLANSAANGGAIDLQSTSPATLLNCSFNANSATMGGAVRITSSAPTFTNCTFVANSATTTGGGALYINSGSAPSITNCTFTANTGASGNSIYLASATGVPVVTNSIFWGNHGSVPASVFGGVGTPSVNYSDVQFGVPFGGGTGNVNADPLFRGRRLGPDHRQQPAG